METIVLTPKQTAIIRNLQNGGHLITSSDSKEVICTTNTKAVLTFSSTLFYKMVKMGLLAQQLDWPFDYGLTQTGKELKVKPAKANRS